MPDANAPTAKLRHPAGATGAEGRYAAVQLHERSGYCWAVIGRKDGAIVTDECGSLVMRLTEREARELAGAWNAELELAGGRSQARALRGVLAGASDRSLAVA